MYRQQLEIIAEYIKNVNTFFENILSFFEKSWKPLSPYTHRDFLYQFYTVYPFKNIYFFANLQNFTDNLTVVNTKLYNKNVQKKIYYMI